MVNPVISEKHSCVPVEGSTSQIQRMDGKGKREKENHETMKPILLRAHQRSELEATREIHDAVGNSLQRRPVQSIIGVMRSMPQVLAILDSGLDQLGAQALNPCMLSYINPSRDLSVHPKKSLDGSTV